MDSGFDKNKTELGVLVLSVSLQVLSDRNGLLDKHVKILRDLRGKAVGLEKTNDLLSGDGLDLGDTVGITQDDTDLGRGQTLLCKLANVFFNIRGRDLQPRRRSALVRAGTLRDTLSGSMHTTHVAVKQNDEKRKVSITFSSSVQVQHKAMCRRQQLDHSG